jgi:hypothetical protein
VLLVLIQHERAGRCFVATASKEAAGVSLTPSKNTRSTRKGLQSNRANAGLLIKNTVHVEKLESVVGLVQKVKTSCALASENKDSYLLRRDIVWGCVQWKIACCSSWTSSL